MSMMESTFERKNIHRKYIKNLEWEKIKWKKWRNIETQSSLHDKKKISRIHSKAFTIPIFRLIGLFRSENPNNCLLHFNDASSSSSSSCFDQSSIPTSNPKNVSMNSLSQHWFGYWRIFFFFLIFFIFHIRNVSCADGIVWNLQISIVKKNWNEKEKLRSSKVHRISHCMLIHRMMQYALTLYQTKSPDNKCTDTWVEKVEKKFSKIVSETKLNNSLSFFLSLSRSPSVVSKTHSKSENIAKTQPILFVIIVFCEHVCVCMCYISNIL